MRRVELLAELDLGSTSFVQNQGGSLTAAGWISVCNRPKAGAYCTNRPTMLAARDSDALCVLGSKPEGESG